MSVPPGIMRAADAHLLKLQRLQSRPLRAIGNLDRYTPATVKSLRHAPCEAHGRCGELGDELRTRSEQADRNFKIPKWTSIKKRAAGGCKYS
jgi:hypothetical protein